MCFTEREIYLIIEGLDLLKETNWVYGCYEFLKELSELKEKINEIKELHYEK